MNLRIARELRRVARERSDTALTGLKVALRLAGWERLPAYMADYLVSPDGTIRLEFYYSMLSTTMKVWWQGRYYGMVNCGLVRHDGGNHEMVMTVHYEPMPELPTRHVSAIIS